MEAANRRRCTVILAAGQGTRMKSPLPKVLHPVAGVPMVVWSIEAALQAGSDQVVLVVGHERQQVIDAVRARFAERVQFAVQEQQRGTADAARAGLSMLSADVTDVVITYGDVPCVPAAALQQLASIRVAQGCPMAMMTTVVDDPTGYGRVLKEPKGRIVAVREHKDCSPDELKERCVNPGLYAVDRKFLETFLGTISSNNAQGEFYLTDLVALASRAGGVAELPWEPLALRGVNDRAELSAAEHQVRMRLADHHRRNGASLAAGVLLDHDVLVEPNAVIGPHVVLRGATVVRAEATVDVGCVVEDSEIGRGALLKPYSVVVKSQIHAGAQVGPFAHVRPDSVVEENAHVGNFVELKKTRLGRGAKANHLAYLGDGVVGPNANIGAGTIFCNYDGYKKHTTTIEEGAFIGSNSSLVAPVTIGKNAYVGSGSVVTRDVPEDALAVGRARQENKEGYGALIRSRLKPR